MFTGLLYAMEGPKSEEWTLTEVLGWRGSTLSADVPARFITDLASIPRLFRGLIEVNGAHRRAAVLHDYLYVMQTVSRAEADRAFLEAMAWLGVGFIKRQAMYQAVRLGGGAAWARGEKASRLDRSAWLAFNGIAAEAFAVSPPPEIDYIKV